MEIPVILFLRLLWPNVSPYCIHFPKIKKTLRAFFSPSPSLFFGTIFFLFSFLYKGCGGFFFSSFCLLSPFFSEKG